MKNHKKKKIRTIVIWDLFDLKPIKCLLPSYTTYTKSISAISFSPNGNYLGSSGLNIHKQ